MEMDNSAQIGDLKDSMDDLKDTVSDLVETIQDMADDDGDDYNLMLSAGVDEGLKPSKSNEIGRIDILDEMHFEMDITIHSIPSSGWANVFHATPSGSNCCNVGDRMPGIWLDPRSGTNAFLVVWDSNGNGNFHFWTHNEADSLVEGETYHLEIDVT